ncbi:histone-lysine N-methyltransferase ASHH3-like isoform X1 [Panicum miliaceum]|uniref:Histone-lysine N-methyltransferase ASHH3-like isoform X1 n=1 Tax=Panicum miliaceum TaxID=4540 RepID=A0A3L6QPW0_PANMI|nr:histone-lysine N-methyltransferase ASHH3-like isoform X1 [Panicum miliaceum]
MARVGSSSSGRSVDMSTMYTTLRDALKIMAFSVPVSLRLVHQLRVAKTAIVVHIITLVLLGSVITLIPFLKFIENLLAIRLLHLMLFSCCSSSCECDNTCANKPFQHRPLKNTKLITTEKCGFGLVAEDEIKKGEFVVEYVGEVIDDRTCENRLWQMKRLSDTNFYLCEVSSNMVIDATDKGNMSRFINHSCEPNTEMQKWTVDGETRVGIFALRDIKKGEELTYDYKFVQFGADQDCHCGSSNCRKMLGTTKSINSMFLRTGYSVNSHNQYVGCWIIDFDQETKVHTLQFTDLHVEKFNLKEEEWHFLLV